MASAKRSRKRPAAKAKTAKSAKTSEKAAARKPGPKKAPGKPAPQKKLAAKQRTTKPGTKRTRPPLAGEDVVYSDVRRELRESLIGRLFSR